MFVRTLCNFLGMFIIVYLFVYFQAESHSLKLNFQSSYPSFQYRDYSHVPPCPGLGSDEDKTLGPVHTNATLQAELHLQPYDNVSLWENVMACVICEPPVWLQNVSSYMTGNFYSSFCLMSCADSDLSRILHGLFCPLRTQWGLLVGVWLQCWCCWLPHLQRVGPELGPGKSPVLMAELMHFIAPSQDTDTH